MIYDEKVFKSKEVNVIQELYKEGYHIESLHSHGYSMPNIKNKKKVILNLKVQVDKGKKLSRLWDCFKCFSRNPSIHCDHANFSLFNNEDDFEIG